MSITTKTFYNKYKLNVIADIRKIEDQLEKEENALFYFNEKLMDCPECLNTLLAIDRDEIKYRDISAPTEIYKLYIQRYHRTNIHIKVLKHELNKLERIKKLKYSEYLHWIESINHEISKYILRNNTFNFGFHIGEMMVGKKERYTGKKYNNKVVDWDASLTQLLNIADWTNDATKELAANYESRKIKRNHFIKLMKPYVYSNTQTDKPKWIMYYTDDGNVWWHWVKTFCNLPNKTLYSFMPTHYINLTIDGKRSQRKVSETFSIDEILNDTRLGNLDKIQSIRRIDPQYFTNTI